MNYRQATDEEVQKYFASHPDHLEMMLDDREEHGDLDIERETIYDFTEFVLVPDLGVVPTYWDAELLHDVRTPDWSSEIYGAFAFKIFRILWFVIAEFTEYNKRELKVFLSTDFNEAVTEAERREQKNHQAFEDYYYEYNHQIFSNGKQLVEILLMPDVVSTQLEEIESRSAPGFPEPEDLYASICQSDEGDIYVRVNPLGGPPLLMKVDSFDEARVIVSELWQ